MPNASNHLLERPVIDREDPQATIEWLLQLCRTWQAEPETAGKQFLLAGWISVEFGYPPNLQYPRPTTSLSAARPEWLEWLMVSGINLLLTEDHKIRERCLAIFIQDAEGWLLSRTS